MSINHPIFKLSELAPSAKPTGYQTLLGEQAWGRLHPDIQMRFGPKVNQAVNYAGVMSEVNASLAGRLFAQLCRLIGTPLATQVGKNVPILVKVYPNHKLQGMTWDRFYQFSNNVVNRVKSTKVIRANARNKTTDAQPSELVEMVGYGFGMKLDVSEVDGALRFTSSEFFWEFAKFRIKIPDWLSPGKTVVQQKALADGQFEFRLNVEHPILGKVFAQVGVFAEAGCKRAFLVRTKARN